MTDAWPHGSTADAHFGFSKLVVHDLEKCTAFYQSVCGLVEHQRVEATIDGRPIREINFLPTQPGGGSLTLLAFADAEGPRRDELILGFTTSDIEAFVDRVKAAGGRLTDPIRVMPEHGIRVAFVEDPEGHRIEVVQVG
jgi:catechol 2,3-dioxygenase-like lactoylglutathione lyase family enzyme